MSSKRREGTFTGSDGVHTIHYTVYEPEHPVAVYQISHGMADHIGRYADFAAFLCEHGFVVCGDDLMGHGSTGAATDELGYYGDNFHSAKDAMNALVDDTHQLTLLMKEQYPNLPYVLMGHSMGSMICRVYLARYGKELDAAVVMGTCGFSGSSKVAGIASFLCSVIALLKGRRHQSALLDKMAFGAYNERFAEENDSISWLSANPENREIYRQDPWAGFALSCTAFGTMMELIRFISKPAWVHQVPRTLPILLTSGGDDPVGNYGKGPTEVYEGLRKADRERVRLKLYAGDRHEILNEMNRQQVYEDILTWVNGQLAR